MRQMSTERAPHTVRTDHGLHSRSSASFPQARPRRICCPESDPGPVPRNMKATARIHAPDTVFLRSCHSYMMQRAQLQYGYWHGRHPTPPGSRRCAVCPVIVSPPRFTPLFPLNTSTASGGAAEWLNYSRGTPFMCFLLQSAHVDSRFGARSPSAPASACATG